MTEKDEIRTRAWQAIRDAGAARFPGVEGRIPNFTGSESAAERLASAAAWKRANAVKSNPDSPQLPVRKRALADGKVVYMAVPKLADEQPFWRLDPEEIGIAVHRAASIKGASEHAVSVDVDAMPHIDLIVCGSVAVERGGARLGKGGGYSDLEFAIGVEAGIIDEHTVIATTVHPCQVLESGAIPLAAHDFGLDLIVTPDETIWTDTSIPRPPGVLWEHLGQEKRASIPVLAER